MASLLTDTSFIKLYDIIGKSFLAINTKEVIFSVNLSISIILQIILFRFIRNNIIKKDQLNKANFRVTDRILQLSQYALIILASSLIFQVFYYSYYYSFILVLFIIITYGVSSILIGILLISFIRWYQQKRTVVLFMYIMSFSVLVFNVISTNVVVCVILSDKPDRIREFVGGSMDLSAGRYSFYSIVIKVSSILSFFSLWLTTILFTHTFKDKMIKDEIKYWIMPIFLLIYFLISYFSQEIFYSISFPYIRSDPYLVSAVFIMIITLAKPLGGILFALSFWSISKTVRYQKLLSNYILISGYGFLLLFSSNQSTSIVLAPYPPFGIATIIVFIIGAYLTTTGIFTSASLLSKNTELRISIYKFSKESKLFGVIGKAEMEKEMGKTVNKILAERPVSDGSELSNSDLDEIELKNYLGKVLEELRKRKNI
jgi:hypothetical protein